jgi:hypothetical protein
MGGFIKKPDMQVRQEVVAMFRNNFSYTQIAVKLGLPSRSAAAGHVNRARAAGVELPDRQDRSAARAAAHQRVRIAKMLKPTPEPLEPRVEVVPSVRYHKPSTDLSPVTFPRRKECAWPIGDPHLAGFKYCCAPCEKTYCDEHAKLAYVPTPPTQKRRNYVKPIPAFR